MMTHIRNVTPRHLRMGCNESLTQTFDRKKWDDCLQTGRKFCIFANAKEKRLK